jgi:hypothetical protein
VKEREARGRQPSGNDALSGEERFLGLLPEQEPEQESRDREPARPPERPAEDAAEFLLAKRTGGREVESPGEILMFDEMTDRPDLVLERDPGEGLAPAAERSPHEEAEGQDQAGP